MLISMTVKYFVLNKKVFDKFPFIKEIFLLQI